MHKYVVLEARPRGGGPPQPVEMDPLTGALLLQLEPVATVPVSGAVTIIGAAPAVDLGGAGVVTWVGGAAPAALRGWKARVASGSVRVGPSGTDATHGLTVVSGEFFGDDNGSSLSGWFVYSAAGATLEIAGIEASS